MSEELTFQEATRTTVKPLIGLVGKSGGGKTLTALLVARGIVGPNGRIGMVDTENGRGSYFADMVPGGYRTINLQPPFGPDNYSRALDAMNQVDIGIIDSSSHEWQGEGGYLDLKEAALDRMAGNDWKKREKCALAAAAQCKPAHNRFIQKMLRLPIPLILCFRGKDKVRLEKNAEGKAEIKVDDFASPIQDSGLIFEMLLAGEVFAYEDKPDIGGFFRPTKITHPGIRPCLPKEGEQFGIKHGEAIAKWCAGGKMEPPPTTHQPDDMMLSVESATDDGELTRLVAESNTIEDTGRKKKIKLAIQQKAKSLGLEWSIQSNAFIRP